MLASVRQQFLLKTEGFHEESFNTPLIPKSLSKLIALARIFNHEWKQGLKTEHTHT